MRTIMIEFLGRPYIESGPRVLLHLPYPGDDLRSAIEFAKKVSRENTAVCAEPHFIVIADNSGLQLWLGLGGPAPI